MSTAVEEFHEALVSQSLEKAGGPKWWIARTFNSMFVFNLVAVWSIVVYSFLFYMFIPTPMHFSTDVYFNYSVSRPLAQVTLDSIPFRFKEDYSVSIELIVPQNEANQNLGVFMIESTLVGKNVSIQSARPCSLPHHAQTSRVFADLVLAPIRLLTTTWCRPEDTVQVILFDKYTAPLPREQAAANMNIELSANMVNIKQAKLHVMVLLQGFRYYMFHWFWLCALLSITLLAIFHLVLAIVFFASESQHDNQ